MPLDDFFLVTRMPLRAILLACSAVWQSCSNVVIMSSALLHLLGVIISSLMSFALFFLYSVPYILYPVVLYPAFLNTSAPTLLLFLLLFYLAILFISTSTSLFFLF